MSSVWSFLLSSVRFLTVSCVWLLALAFAACGQPAPSDALEAVHYVTTIAPFGAVLGPVVEPRGHVEVLLTPGASPHTHGHRPSDARDAHDAQALFYGAPSLDGWAADLEASVLIELVPLVPDTLQIRLEDGTVDPHIWTDPLAVQALLPVLADTLCVLDVPGCSGYQARATAFAADLERLHQRLEQEMASLAGKPVILSHPFFHYFLQRYGLRLVSVVEPSPGQEASPRRLTELIRDARQIPDAVVCVQGQLPDRAAYAVAEAAGLPIVPLDPIGGVEGRTTYADLLLYNARRLREAFE